MAGLVGDIVWGGSSANAVEVQLIRLLPECLLRGSLTSLTRPAATIRRSLLFYGRLQV
jgi:hypothetical protein